jgi:hypothetical protein
MIGLKDRQALARDIDTAHAAGARLQPACGVAGIDMRALESPPGPHSGRWQTQRRAPDA